MERPRQFKSLQEEPLLSRREAIRDSVAFFSVLGAYFLGKGGNSEAEAQRTATLSAQFQERLTKVETLSVGNSISLRGLEESGLDMKTVLDALNNLASYELQTRQMLTQKPNAQTGK